MKSREPQGPIQRAFGALLGMLDLKGVAVVPNSLAGDTQGVLDLRPFLDARPHQVIGGTFTLNADDYSTRNFSADGPAEGRAWLVRSLSARVTLSPLCTLFSLGVIRTTKRGSIAANQFDDITTYSGAPVAVPAGTATAFVIALCDKPFILLPGESVGMSFSYGHAGAVDSSAYVQCRFVDVPM